MRDKLASLAGQLRMSQKGLYEAEQQKSALQSEAKLQLEAAIKEKDLSIGDVLADKQRAERDGCTPMIIGTQSKLTAHNLQCVVSGRVSTPLHLSEGEAEKGSRKDRHQYASSDRTHLSTGFRGIIIQHQIPPNAHLLRDGRDHTRIPDGRIVCWWSKTKDLAACSHTHKHTHARERKREKDRAIHAPSLFLSHTSWRERARARERQREREREGREK